MIDAIAIIVGLVLLIKGGDWLLDASVALSLRLSVPKIVIGMTVVSFATSAPELIVSVKSALKGFPDLALGNVVGSNIANLAFVLGTVILISPIDVTKSFYKTDWPIMILATFLFYFFLVDDRMISQIEGGILILALVVFLLVILVFQKKAVIEESIQVNQIELSLQKILALLFLGGFCLWLGAEVLVSSAVSIAQALGMSERIVSISVISIGTSIPELSASIIAILNKEKAISLGNLIGSNIFNILAVMGTTALIHPVKIVDPALLSNDMYWMLAVSISILPLVFFPRYMRLGRYEGLLLLIFYFVFIYQMFS